MQLAAVLMPSTLKINQSKTTAPFRGAQGEQHGIREMEHRVTDSRFGAAR